MAKKDFELTFGIIGAATAITGLESLINLTKQLTAVVKDQARAVSEYTSVISNHSVSVRAADEATSGLIDTVELHRAAAQIEEAQIEINEQQFRSLAVAGAQFAQRTGIPVTEAFQNITNAAISAEAEGLRRFGITLGTGGTIAERQIEVLRALQNRFGETTVEIRNIDEAISQLSNTWGSVWTEMLADLERSIPWIRRLISGLTSELQEILNALEAARNAADNRERRERADPARRQQAELDEVRRQMGMLEMDGLTSGNAITRAAFRAQVVQAAQQGGNTPGHIAMARYRRELAARERRLIPQIATIRREAPRPEEPAAPEAVAPGTGFMSPAALSQLEGEGEEARTAREVQARLQNRPEEAEGAASRAAAAAREAAREEEQRQRMLTRLKIDINQARVDDQERTNQRLIDNQQATADAMLEMRTKELEDERAAEEERKRIQESATQREELLMRQREERLDRLTEVTNASTNLIGKVAELAVTIAGKSERAQKIANAIIGTATIARETVAAAVEIARAVSSAASNDYGAAALHGIAAGLHVAAAAKAAAELGGKKKGSSGSSSGTSTANRPEFTSGNERLARGDQNTVTIVNHGPITSREVQDDLNAAARNAARRAA